VPLAKTIRKSTLNKIYRFVDVPPKAWAALINCLEIANKGRFRDWFLFGFCS
jgi:hypothetical protein